MPCISEDGINIGQDRDLTLNKITIQSIQPYGKNTRKQLESNDYSSMSIA